MNTDLVEELALRAADMKPLGLDVANYVELPPAVLTVEPSDFASLSHDDIHVEIVAQCDGCGRPFACKAQLLDGKIVADGSFEHMPPLGPSCKAKAPTKMSAFRRLIFRAAGERHAH